MSDSLTIYKQIYPRQCAKLYELGYRSVINIRPENEVANQPTSEALRLAAEHAHLAYTYLPYDFERLGLETIAKFAEYYHDLPKPILMFCGTGHRAKLLYQSACMQDLL